MTDSLAGSFDHLLGLLWRPHDAAEWTTYSVAFDGLTIWCDGIDIPTFIPQAIGRLPVSSASTPDVHLTIGRIGALPPFPQGGSTVTRNDVSQRAEDGYLWLRFGPFLDLVLHPASGRGLMALSADYPLPSVYLYRPLVAALQLLLSRQGYALVHAAAAEWAGKGVLLIGRPNSGKTTLILAGVKAGSRFLADDACLVRRGRQGDFVAVRLLDAVWATPDVLERYPGLSAHVLGRTADGKRALFHLGECYPDVLGTSAPVRLVAICQPAAALSLQAVQPADALNEMLAYSLDVSDLEIVRQRLEMLAALVESVPCVRLNLSVDPRPAVDLIQQALVCN